MSYIQARIRLIMLLYALLCINILFPLLVKNFNSEADAQANLAINLAGEAFWIFNLCSVLTHTYLVTMYISSTFLSFLHLYRWPSPGRVCRLIHSWKLLVMFWVCGRRPAVFGLVSVFNLLVTPLFNNQIPRIYFSISHLSLLMSIWLIVFCPM